MGELYNKLEKYNKEYLPMHMPGHKRNSKMLGNSLPYNIDITEVEGFDDLHHPEEIIKDIQDRAKKLFGSDESFILVNGSTCGILAGIRSMVKPHDKILVARNCHKSVYNAIELNFLDPIYVMPKKLKSAIDGSIDAKDIEQNLKENPGIKLVVITSPTYEGVISNIKEICKIAHSYNIPVLVDEAHGAHLNFMENLKEYEALNSGADIVVQSLHKTLPALTQTAIMHIKGTIVDKQEAQRQISIFETSSPSYLLMASIDECIKILEEQRQKLFENYKRGLEEFYDNAKKLQKLQILGNIINNVKYDTGKIVIITNNCNINGKQLAKILREKYKIETEMANTNYVIAMTSACDSGKNFKRLFEALEKIDSEIEYTSNKIKEVNVELPRKKISINDALRNSNDKFVEFKEAEGKISKEYIWIYPPGIPMVTPGEIISKEIIEKLEEILREGIEVRTSNNKFPEVKIL